MRTQPSGRDIIWQLSFRIVIEVNILPHFHGNDLFRISKQRTMTDQMQQILFDVL